MMKLLTLLLSLLPLCAAAQEPPQALPEAQPEAEARQLSPRAKALRGFELLANPASDAAARDEGFLLTVESALAGDPVGMANLGFLAAEGGDGMVTPDPEKALYWYTRALDAGLSSAAYNLLDLHDRTPELEVPEETLGRAHLILGEAYAKGNTPMGYSFEESLKQYLAAARLGNRQAVAILQELLGMFPDALGSLSEEDMRMIFPGE